MILPQGRKKTIICDFKPSSIIKAIKMFGFTGQCKTSIAGKEVYMVFQDGACLLAECLPDRGNDAYEKILEQSDYIEDFSLFVYLPGEIIFAVENNQESAVGFDTSKNSVADPVNLFEKVLADLKNEDISALKSKIQTEIEDFLLGSGMSHLIEEK